MRPKSDFRKREYRNLQVRTVCNSKAAATKFYTQKAHQLRELESQIDDAVIQYDVANTQLGTLKKSRTESNFNFHAFQRLYHKALEELKDNLIKRYKNHLNYKEEDLEGQLTAIKKQEKTKEYEQQINQNINNN